MAINSLDDYIASAKQIIPWIKTASRTSVAAIPFSVFDIAGQPGAGTLAGSNTANGLVPTTTTAGYPTINSFGGATGYVSNIDFGNTVACRITLYDRLFLAGAYAFNAATSLTTQPSYSGRVPGGTDYTNTELWIECVTTFTGNQSIAVTYTNQAGTAAHTTGTIATGVAPTIGRCLRLPLQAGDTGIQKVESVTSTVATVGTFNVMILRSLWTGRCRIANDGDVHDMLRTGMIQVFDTSALYALVIADSTSTGVPEIQIQLASK